MSLLLDALNRASRDKVAAAAAVPEELPISAAPLVAADQAVNSPLPPNAPAWPPLEFSLSSPDPAPVVKSPDPVVPWGGNSAGLSLTPQLPATALAAEPVSSPAPAAPAKPAEPVAAAPAATAPRFNPEPAPAPQDGVRAAQNIVRAKAPPATARNRRSIVLLAVAMLLGAGMASVWLGLGADPRTLAGMLGFEFEADKTSAVIVAASPAVAASPGVPAVPAIVDVQPAAPAVVAPKPPETVAVTPLPEPAAPAERVPRTPTVRSPARDASALPAQTTRLNDKAQASVQSSSSGPSIMEMAYQDLLSGRLLQAGAAYAQALAVNPQERDALLGLAYIAQKQGRKDEALSFYRQVLRQEPGNVTARAGLLSLNPPGDSQEFGNQSREVAEQNPDSAAAQSALGHALVRQDRLADARVAFSRAMQLAPEVPRHAFNLAVALDRLHNYDEARRYYERAASLLKKTGSESTSGFALADVMTRLEQLRHAASSPDLPLN